MAETLVPQEKEAQPLESKHDMEEVAAAMQEHMGGIVTIYGRLLAREEGLLKISLDDFYQEVFLAITRSSNFINEGPWIIGVARNVARNLKTHARRDERDVRKNRLTYRTDRSSRISETIDFSDETAWNPNAIHEDSEQDKLEALRAALENLQPQFRVAIDIELEGLRGVGAGEAYKTRVLALVGSGELLSACTGNLNKPDDTWRATKARAHRILQGKIEQALAEKSFND